MEKIMDKKIVESVERKVALGADLLEIAMVYCENNSENSKMAAPLSSLLEIIFKNQCDIANAIDGIMM